MANVFYDKAKKNLWNGTTDLAGTVKVALVTSSYSPNIATDEFWSTPQAFEVSGTGYTANGATLGSVTVTADTTNHRGVLSGANVTWSSSTITAAGAVLYYSTGTAGTSPLIGYIDFGGDKSSTAANFTIQWDAVNGIAYF